MRLDIKSDYVCPFSISYHLVVSLLLPHRQDGLVISLLPTLLFFSTSSNQQNRLVISPIPSPFLRSTHPATGSTLTASTSNNVSTTGFPVIPVHWTKISSRSSHSPFSLSTPLSLNGFLVTGPNFWNWPVKAGVSKLAMVPSKSVKKERRQDWEPSDCSWRA